MHELLARMIGPTLICAMFNSLVNQTRVLISPIDKRSATKGSGSRDLCNVINGHVEVEQAPFAPAIARWYQAVLSIARFVLPILEYCTPIWDPYHQKYIRQIEMVQHRAARFVLGKPWRRCERDSITNMLN